MNTQELTKEIEGLEFNEIISLYIAARMNEPVTADKFLSEDGVDLMYRLEKEIDKTIDVVKFIQS